MNQNITLGELGILDLGKLKNSYAGGERDLEKAMRRTPVVSEATIEYQDALLKGIPSSEAKEILASNFSSKFTANKIIYAANIMNLMFSKSSFQDKSILEIGPGQFAFSLLARSLGGYLTVLDKNDFFIEVAKALNFKSAHLDYYLCSSSAMPTAFEGLWLKGSFSPLISGQLGAIEDVANKITKWITNDGWGLVAPNAKTAKFEQRFGTHFESEMERLIEGQREVMEGLGWTSVSLNENLRRYLGLASRAYDASAYIYAKNLDLSRVSQIK